MYHACNLLIQTFKFLGFKEDIFQFFILIKGGFFSESAIHFSNLQISKQNILKNYPELEI